MFLLALIWVLFGVALGWRFGSRRSTSQALTQASGPQDRYHRDQRPRI